MVTLMNNYLIIGNFYPNFSTSKLLKINYLQQANKRLTLFGLQITQNQNKNQNKMTNATTLGVKTHRDLSPVILTPFILTIEQEVEPWWWLWVNCIDHRKQLYYLLNITGTYISKRIDLSSQCFWIWGFGYLKKYSSFYKNF